MEFETRMRRLERANRLLLLGLFGGIALVTMSGATASNSRDITADKITTRALYVTNPYGKQGVQIEVGDSGMTTLVMTDTHGRQSIGLGTDPAGTPVVCLSVDGKCRVLLGKLYRGKSRELTVELRNRKGETVWMPEARNSE